MSYVSTPYTIVRGGGGEGGGGVYMAELHGEENLIIYASKKFYVRLFM